MPIVTLTEENFDATVSESDLVVLDFWAPWCSPCRSFNAVIEAIHEDCADVLFAKVNIDEEAALAEEFEVKSVPAVLVVKKQVVVFAQSGLMPKDALLELIDQARTLDVSNL